MGKLTINQTRIIIKILIITFWLKSHH